MALRPWHLLSLCDGYAGTELALRSVARVRTVCRVERDAYAAAVLVERMEQARLDSCPVWDDLVTFDGAAWRGRVDIVAAGFPCQPFSTAGKRAGTDDDRWLWPDIARIVGDVEPDYVLLENVPQLLAHGLPEVLHDLAALGFDAEWGLLAASAVGAPHRRERLWLVAHRRSEHGQQVSDSFSRSVCSGLRGDTHGRRATVGHTNGSSIPRWPPSPDDRDGWAEWIAAGGPQPVVRRRADGPPLGLADALHLGGNGLVPQCAAHAWGQLLERAGWELT